MHCSLIARRAGHSLALVAALLTLGVFPLVSLSASEVLTARLDRTTVPASGSHSAVLSVNAFGRYSVTATSTQGVALRVVDHMAGAGPVVGEMGKTDGRLDLFLDRGEHKIVTFASDYGSGQVTLAAHAFRELNSSGPLLVEHRLERSSLGDFEQRSYWIEIKERRVVALEAAGRYLSDLRLWRDGIWLVDHKPKMSQSQARPEQPLAVARLVVELDPGLYLLSAYGGSSQPWTSVPDDLDPKLFLLRFGIPTLGPELRQQFTMGEFGVERFLVSGSPDYFRLELPSAHDASLKVSRFDERRPYEDSGTGASIDKRSMPPVAEVRHGGGDAQLITVSMAQGKSFVLQHFKSDWNRVFSGSGDYWVSSIHAGHSEDSVGATAVLTDVDVRPREQLVDARVVEIDGAWRRRFNLLDEMTLFFKVSFPTVLRVVGDGVKARYRIEPFLTSRPVNYEAPSWEESGHAFTLLNGLYVLTVKPETRGILDLHLLSGFSGKQKEMTPVSAVARFPSIRLNSRHALYLNRQPGVAAGTVIRRLPIDLTEALSVGLKPNESLTIPVSIPERGVVRARTDVGELLELDLGNGKKGKSIDVERGEYRVTLSAGALARSASLGFEPIRLASTTPLPPMPDTRLAELPKFPVITPGAPRYLDLDRNANETYNIQVDQPGLYQFETTGLLHTGGKVRTRINPSLFEAVKNGVGQNFMIQRYLRQGDYQLTVSTLGMTQGHLGVRVERTELVDGGELRDGEVARAFLPTGKSLSYQFRIAERGSYRLESIGLGRNFDVRLEDGQGWPVVEPIRSGDISVDFAPGDYRLLVMPQTAEARVLTRLDRVSEAKRYEGHGPHRIPLGDTVMHTWVEPVEGAPREPDQWEFVLPARAEVNISLDNEMVATLMDVGGVGDAEKPVADFDSRQSWRGELAAGVYRVQSRHTRKNNLVPYSVRIGSTQLLAGQTRTVITPSVNLVSVGTDGLVEIESFGRSDVRARLFDSAGVLVAQNDDRPGDWNFQIAQRLGPGEYRLEVDPVNERNSSTTIAMRAPADIVEPPLVLNKDVEIKDVDVHLYPLSLPADSNVLMVSAQSSDALGLALEALTPQGWINLGTRLGKTPYLVLPLSEHYSGYRLRAWLSDRRSLHMKLRAVAAKLPVTSERQWLAGKAEAVPVDGKRPGLRVAMIALSRPGIFRFVDEMAKLRWSDSRMRVADDRQGGAIAVSGTSLWLVSEEQEKGASSKFAAERLLLPTGSDESLRVALSAGQEGVVDRPQNPKGPSLIFAKSRSGQPGVMLGAERNLAAMGFVPGEAVAVAGVGEEASIRLWNAGDLASSIEMDVGQVSLLRADVSPLGLGVSDGVMRPRAALMMALPGGALRIRLTLSPMSAVQFRRRGQPVSTHWAGESAMQEMVTTDADEVWLLNASEVDAPYGVDIASYEGEVESPLRVNDLFERNLGTVGRIRVPVDVSATTGREIGKDNAYVLHLRGDAQALWQESGGRIFRPTGNDIEVRDSGVLWVLHRPGTVVAWLDEMSSVSSERVGRWLESFQHTIVRPPKTVELKGKQKSFVFHMDQPAMLHVRSTTPVVTQFLVPGQVARTDAHLNGANANLPLPSGSSVLMLRAVGADALSGEASMTTTPVVRLQDGPGPEVLLAPGSARLFEFTVEEQGTVGIGVRASSDVIRSVLLDEHGVVQSEGVVQMPLLVPGRYFLVVEMPTDSPPVRVRPMMIGLKKRDTRPPYDILRRYVEAVDGDALLYVPPVSEDFVVVQEESDRSHDDQEEYPGEEEQ